MVHVFSDISTRAKNGYYCPDENNNKKVEKAKQELKRYCCSVAVFLFVCLFVCLFCFVLFCLFVFFYDDELVLEKSVGITAHLVFTEINP